MEPLVPSNPHPLTHRINLESPRPRHASRSTIYTLRSSPLAGPAIAASSPTHHDTPRLHEEQVESEKTRTGATPSRISSLSPTPPSSLRSVSVSRTPSPTRSEFSVRSSASSATSTTPSSIILPAPQSVSKPRAPPEARIRQPHRGRTSTSISRPSPSEYHAFAAPYKPESGPDPSRNWLTRAAPPTFSRLCVNGVVMPVKASEKRPQTAPAAPASRCVDLRDTVLHGKHAYRMEPISLNEGFNEHRSMSIHKSRDSGHHGTPSVSPFASLKRKPRRPRSMMSFPLHPTLGEVREEHEREGECEGESGEDGTAQGGVEQFVAEKLRSPGLTRKDGCRDTSAVVRQEPEKVTGWTRLWKNPLKRFKGTL